MSLGTSLALLISAAGVAVALGTLVRAYLEYAQQGRQRRAELFFTLRGRLKAENLGRIAELVDLTASGDQAEAEAAKHSLVETPLRDKRDYLGLFEEVAVFMEKGQVEPRLAHYMFGYYALRCRECGEFWSNIAFTHDYWTIFHDFCEDTARFRERLAKEEVERSGPGRKAYISEDGRLIDGAGDG
jgi:hypothetical protein